MKFDISNLHTIFESTEEDSTNVDTLGNVEDLQQAFKDACPISGEIFKAMKKSAADPQNLKITASQCDESTTLFIEAVEFMTFCEANDMNVGEAADKIIDTYQNDIPGIGVTDINVVFPADSMNKDVLGGQNQGINVKNDWAMQLMTGCRRYGLKPRCVINEKE